MGFFRQANNVIVIQDATGQSAYDATWWISTQEPAYITPAGLIERVYHQTIVHRIYSTVTGQTDDVVPWVAGDTYISKRAVYDAAQRLATMSLAQAKQYILDKLQAYVETVRDDGIVVSGVTYKSDIVYGDRWKEEYEYASRNSFLLSSYYLVDISGNEVVVPSVVALANIVNVLDEFYWSLQQTYDNHVQAINALGTVAAVLSYDYTVGWVPTPFDKTTTFYASYATDVDADYAAGASNATVVGNAVIDANRLKCAFNDVSYVDYGAASNASSQQVGTLKFKYIPNYSNAPASNQRIVTVCRANADARNLVQLSHLITTGGLEITVNDQGGNVKVSGSLGNWLPTAGTEYLMELHYDITTGNTWLKIDNVQFGVTKTGTGNRDTNIGLLRVGGSFNSGTPTNSNFYMKQLRITSV